MTCKVSCLVPRPEQLEPLIQRIRAAGIEARDIRVVPHEQWRLLPGERGEPPRPPARSWYDWWSLPLAQAALWYGWCDWSGAASPAADDRENSVISLAKYGAGRRRLPCRTPL